MPRPLPPLLRFVVAHGRGLYDPRIGWWWLCAGPWLLGLVLIDTLSTWIAVRGGHLTLAAWAWLLLVLLWPVWMAWALGGTWRALRRQHVGANTTNAAVARRARWASMGGVLVLAVLTVLAAGTAQAPRLLDRLELAFGGDPLGRLDAKLSPDRQRLHLRGPIGNGDAAQVRRLTAGVDGIELVELQSPGGRWHEAEAIADLARARGWTVRVVGRCANACLALLAGGRSRQVLPPARLALQLRESAAFLPGFDTLAAWWQQRALARAGLSPQALYKASATLEPLWWLVDTDELVPGGFISQHPLALDVDLPARADAPAAQYAEMLAVNTAWHALGQRQPGLLEDAAARMQAARRHGLPPEVVQMAAQQRVDQLAAVLAREAGSERQLERLTLLDEQLAAATAIGEAACRALREGDTAVRRVLPPALATKEAAWLQRTALEPRLQEARPLGPLEREMLRRALGGPAQQRLGSLWRGGGGMDCAGARTLIAAVLALQPAELRLALRAVFVR